MWSNTTQQILAIKIKRIVQLKQVKFVPNIHTKIPNPTIKQNQKYQHNQPLIYQFYLATTYQRSLMNKLQCPLCQNPFTQPCMCPHCSQVYCRRCIKNYLQEFYFCPSCDRHIIDLIDCTRLIDEVKEKIKESDDRKNQKQKDWDGQICREHNMPMRYRCLSCMVDICSDCGIISQNHKSHLIQPLSSIKPPKNMLTQSQLNQIKRKLRTNLSHFQQQQKRLTLQLQLLKSHIQYNKTKIYEYYLELVARLQKETEGMLKDIEDRIGECKREISERVGVKEMIDGMEIKAKKEKLGQKKEEVNVSSPLLLMEVDGIRLTDEKNDMEVEITDKGLYKYLVDKRYIKQPKKKEQPKPQQKTKITSRIRRNLPQKKIQDQQSLQKYQESQAQSQLPHNSSLLFDKKIYQLGTMKQIYPQYHNFSFQMDYDMQKDDEVVYSPSFNVYGYEWRLKIYPQGNAQAANSHMSVFLQLINSPQTVLSTTSPTEYYFRLQLLNLNQAGRSIIKEYNSKFSVGECWGYAEFVELRQVGEYLHDGKLLFVMGVKNVSYFDFCEGLKKYVGKLEGENKVLAQLCSNYHTTYSDPNPHHAPTNLNLDSSLSSLAHHPSHSSLSPSSSQHSQDSIQQYSNLMPDSSPNYPGHREDRFMEGHNERNRRIDDDDSNDISSIISSVIIDEEFY